MARDDRLIRVDAPALGHIPAFDGFRGVFVLLVVFYHAQVTPFLSGMPLVIDWFFVSSGFLITSLMLDERHKRGSVSLRNFYTRRVLRLFPAMYAFLAVFAVLAMLASLLVQDSSELSNWWVDVLAGAFYVYNIVAAADPELLTGAMGHIWSLTVEEQYYFIWPLILVGVLKKASRRSDVRLITGCVIFMALFFFTRSHFQYMVTEASAGELPTFADAGDPTWQGFVYRLASMRPDMIVYGCLIAFVTRAIPRPIPAWFTRFLSIVGPLSWIWFLAVLFLADSGIWGFELWGGPAYQVALLLLGPGILDTFFRPETRYTSALTWGPISWLGVRAYGIYLWHVIPLLVILPLMTGTYGVTKLVLGLIGSFFGVLVGLGSYRYIERRFLRMKHRFAGVPVQSADEVLETETATGAGDSAETGGSGNGSTSHDTGGSPDSPDASGHIDLRESELENRRRDAPRATDASSPGDRK